MSVNNILRNIAPRKVGGHLVYRVSVVKLEALIRSDARLVIRALGGDMYDVVFKGDTK